jgi:putative chitinase
MTVKLTTDILIAGCGASSTLAGQWLDAIQAAIDEQGISNSPSNTAAFLANVGVESQGLSTLVENLNYSAQRLAQVWPQRYAVNAFVDNKIPNDTAVRIAATGPQAIANNVYANRMGNGDENSGDGWRFRGQGLIQLTGRTNILAFFARADLPLNTDPSELQTTQLGAASAADFFVNSGASVAMPGEPGVGTTGAVRCCIAAVFGCEYSGEDSEGENPNHAPSPAIIAVRIARNRRSFTVEPITFVMSETASPASSGGIRKLAGLFSCCLTGSRFLKPCQNFFIKPPCTLQRSPRATAGRR